MFDPRPAEIKNVVDASDVCCVLATDGVWEFLTSQEVIDICVSCKTPKEACYRIVAESYRRWYAREERIDDIACCVLYFDGASVASPPPSLREPGVAAPPRLRRRGRSSPPPPPRPRLRPPRRPCGPDKLCSSVLYASGVKPVACHRMGEHSA